MANILSGKGVVFSHTTFRNFFLKIFMSVRARNPSTTIPHPPCRTTSAVQNWTTDCPLGHELTTAGVCTILCTTVHANRC
jgi:hypothetical protein